VSLVSLPGPLSCWAADALKIRETRVVKDMKYSVLCLGEVKRKILERLQEFAKLVWHHWFFAKMKKNLPPTILHFFARKDVFD
jgi:hypothetical protein